MLQLDSLLVDKLDKVPGGQSGCLFCNYESLETLAKQQVRVFIILGGRFPLLLELFNEEDISPSCPHRSHLHNSIFCYI